MRWLSGANEQPEQKSFAFCCAVLKLVAHILDVSRAKADQRRDQNKFCSTDSAKIQIKKFVGGHKGSIKDLV